MSRFRCSVPISWNRAITVCLFKTIEVKLISKPVALEFPKVRQAIVDGIKRRMIGWEDEVNLIIPTILDPYFKITLFPSERHGQYKDMLINAVQNLCTPSLIV
uniref:Bromo domain-containing protein n=1 Tax=Meloidogyne hapla TaxID=6305 RepID=A0A1I8BGX1_MELHA